MAKWQSGKAMEDGDPAKIRTFRDLLVWQRGMDLTRAIYRETARMPKAKLFGLTSQMRRAASSVPMNISEGFGKHTRPEFIRGLRMAMGSLCELQTAYELATSMHMIEPSSNVLDLLAEEYRMLQALIMKLQAKTRAEQQRSRKK